MDSNKQNYKAFLFNIAGVQFHQYKEVLELDALNNGDALDLILEPENQYDDKAVAIYWQGYKLGYIPLKAYDQGVECKSLVYEKGVDKCRCILSKLDVDEKPYRMFSVVLEVEL